MTKTTIELAKMIAILERASSEQTNETEKAKMAKEIASLKKRINSSPEKAKDILKMLSDECKSIKEMSASNFSKAVSILAGSEDLKSLESYKKPSFNWKNFTLDELSDMLPDDVMISHYDTPSKEFQRTYDNTETKKFSKNQRLTISDAGEVEISKGSENIYMEVKCYSASDKNDESEYKVTIYSKDNHSGLKEVASQCIQKMAKGGSIKEKPMSSAFSNFFSKVKTTAKTGLKKGKDFTNKKIHDSKKQIAIDALKDAKKKVKQPEEKFVLTQAVGIMKSKYAAGGNLPDSIPYKHPLEERKELQKEAKEKYAKMEITEAQYDKLMEEASARILKGYSVNVYENKSFQDPLAIAKGSRYVLVTDGLKGDSSTVYSNEPYLFLVKRNIFGNEYLHAEPVNLGAENKWKMFGGKFVFSSDSRFSENISRQPIGIHDRVESYAEGGTIPKGKIILASTGVPLKILKYDKSFGGRVLVERMDEHGKGVKGWMPVSKFKGKFEEGGRISEEELEALKEEYANEDIEILKKQHHLAITDTKKGVVWGMHDNGIFVFNDNKGGTFFTGPESEAKEFLKEVYSVEGEEGDDKMAKGGSTASEETNLWFFTQQTNIKSMYGDMLDRDITNAIKKHNPKNIDDLIKGLKEDQENFVGYSGEEFNKKRKNDISKAIQFVKDYSDKIHIVNKSAIIKNSYNKGGSMYADGGKAILPPQGTMVTKDKSQKLDYKKISPDTYEFVVYDGQTNPMDGYSKTSFKKRNDGVVTMNYNQFVNYIKTEGYVDDSSFALGGSIPTFEIGDWVQEKKGTARGQVYDKLGDFGIYLKDKYGNESRMLYFADRFKMSTRPRYETGGTMELEEEVFILPSEANFLVASVNYPLNNQLKDMTGDGYNLADFTEKRFGNFFVMAHKSTGNGFIVYGKNVYDSLTEEEKSADLQMIRNLGIKIN